MDKYEIPIIPCTPTFTSYHNDLSNQLDRLVLVDTLTGGQARNTIMPCTPIYKRLDLSALVQHNEKDMVRQAPQTSHIRMNTPYIALIITLLENKLDSRKG